MIEEVIEPYLLQQALVQRTPRGRVLGEEGYHALGLTPPADAQNQLEIFRQGGDDDN